METLQELGMLSHVTIFLRATMNVEIVVINYVQNYKASHFSPIKTERDLLLPLKSEKTWEVLNELCLNKMTRHQTSHPGTC